MINMSVSQLVNQVDKSDFTLYAEWEDTCIKIIVLRPCTVPLSGEMYIENANYFLNHLDESFETYLEKTKHAFSGKNSDIQFFLQDDTLTWKQQNILTRGKIAVHSLSNILILSDTLKQSLELYQECQERALALGNENEHLNKTNTKLIADLEEMTRIKTAMEKDIYMKFLLLLNTKKKRIKELQQALNDTKKTTRSAFDETTDDESDGSDVESNKVHGKRAKTRTDEMDYEDEQKIVPKSSKKNLKRRMTFSSSEDTSPEPSTSKSNVTLRNMDIDDTMKPKQILHSSEESEEDIFA